MNTVEKSQIFGMQNKCVLVLSNRNKVISDYLWRENFKLAKIYHKLSKVKLKVFHQAES